MTNLKIEKVMNAGMEVEFDLVSAVTEVIANWEKIAGGLFDTNRILEREIFEGNLVCCIPWLLEGVRFLDFEKTRKLTAFNEEGERTFTPKAYFNVGQLCQVLSLKGYIKSVEVPLENEAKAFVFTGKGTRKRKSFDKISDKILREENGEKKKFFTAIVRADGISETKLSFCGNISIEVGGRIIIIDPNGKIV